MYLQLKLLIKKKKAEEKNKEILGHLLYVASVIAKEQKLDEGFRIVINDGQNGGLFLYNIFFVNLNFKVKLFLIFISIF